MKKAYGKLVKFDPIILDPLDEQSDWFLFLPYTIKYGNIYKKKFFQILYHNDWIERNFTTLDEEFHVIQRVFIKHKKTPLTGDFRDYISACETCIEKKDHLLRCNRHFVFRGPPNALFTTLIKEPIHWCTLCRQSPLYDIYTANECKANYGDFLHVCCPESMSCTMCINGEKLSKTWYENFE